MKTKMIVSGLCCSLFVLSSCTSNMQNLSGNALFSPVAKVGQQQTDSDILGTMRTVNRNEVAVAREALRKSSNPKVRSYAAYLKTQHTSNLIQALKVGRKIGVKPVENQNARTLQQQGKQEREALAGLHHQAFDKAFIADMITDHTNALQLIDQLTQQASNGALINYLKDTRAHVAMHLQQAKAIQQGLPA